MQVLEPRDLGVDGAQHHAHALLLHEHVHAETANALRRNGEVAFVVRLELTPLILVHDAVGERARLLGGECLTRDRRELAIHLDGRRHAGGDEQIGRLLVRHQLEQVAEDH